MAGGWRGGHCGHAARRTLLALVMAPVWLALAVAVLLIAHPGASAAALRPALPLTATDTPAVAPTDTPPVATATPAAAPTDTPAVVTDTPTDTPLPTDNSGGNTGANQSGASSAPQPTKVNFAQPTVGLSANSAQANATGGVTSSGLLIAALMSCGVMILGVVIAGIALSMLLRGGYGPFLRALLPFSKRRWKKRQQREHAENGGDGSGRDSYGYDDSREWDARDGRDARRPANRPAGGATTRQRDGAAATRGAPRSTHSARGRR
ncbi:MAG TPA: hypothetical protein VJN88_14985 [Ktedonobacterales bacterium]|nr:hypothetical protein [Ktedonobacterales bacterium]